jgi:hypothetical protein
MEAEHHAGRGPTGARATEFRAALIGLCSLAFYVKGASPLFRVHHYGPRPHGERGN